MLTIFRTTLSHKAQLNSNTYLYHFDLLEPKEIIFKPGQYVMLKVPSDKGPVSRLYSIATPNTNRNSFELIIGMIPGGLASNYLFLLKENSEVIFQGPAGMFSLKKNTKEKIFLVTGTGIAPILSILKSQLLTTNYKLPTYLFWGLKYYQEVYLLNELKQWSNETMKQFEFNICLSREENLDTVPETDRKYFHLDHVDSCFLKQFNNLTIKQLNDFDFYLCGGRQIVESLKQFLLTKNILLENIIFEKF